MKIPYVNLAAQYDVAMPALLQAVEHALRSGQYILGDEVKRSEERFAAVCGTQYAVAVANGTDALVLAMKALGIGPGDEVITAPNSFLASCSSIVFTGAKPVFADVRDDMNIDPEKIEAAITSKTKAIMPVHLTGRPADMNAIRKIADAHQLSVIEDAAQAVGAEYFEKRTGALGTIGCFSLHPLKNLAIPGDGGMITTDDPDVYAYLLTARNHGLINRDECAFFSLNSRLDALQAAILNVKLDYLAKWTDRRRQIANTYYHALKEIVLAPTDKAGEKAVYHTYIIQTDRRNALQAYLKEMGIETKVHYPIPIHLQKAAEFLGYHEGDFPVTEGQVNQILSLPVYPELTDDEVSYICQKIQEFFA